MRAFIAIDVPEQIRAELGRMQNQLRAAAASGRQFPSSAGRGDSGRGAGISWTRPEGIHLTLKFLGEISDQQAQDVARAMSALGGFERFAVEVKGFGFFPDARRPRVFWVGLEVPPQLKGLAERVELALERLGFERERRAFTPHLTLARFKSAGPQPAIASALSELGTASLGTFEVSDFFLFESRLWPGGAAYRKVARFVG